jgi:hypothetical protein
LYSGRPDLLDDDTSRDVGQTGRIAEIGTGGDRCRESCDHGITRARYVIYGPGQRFKVDRVFTGAKEGHSLFAASDQDRTELVLVEQLPSGVLDRSWAGIFDVASLGSFPAIWSDNSRASIL